jgi:hypothetical protein
MLAQEHAQIAQQDIFLLLQVLQNVKFVLLVNIQL